MENPVFFSWQNPTMNRLGHVLLGSIDDRRGTLLRASSGTHEVWAGKHQDPATWTMLHDVVKRRET